MNHPPAFQLTRIILFGYRIEDLKKFYVQNFGFTISEETEDNWVVLGMDGIELAFHRVPKQFEPEEGKRFVAESNTKIVFNLKSDLYAFRETLAKAGVVIGEVNSFPGINSLFCDGEDPEGNVFQIEQKLG